MSGIAGIIHFAGRGPGRAAPDALARALLGTGAKVLPDGPAALIGGVEDGLPGCPAPFESEDAIVVVDGWVDDADDLARRAGHSAPIRCDAEAVYVAWRRWGLGALDRLDGELSAAIWDRRNQRLYLVRDRHGTRPLFWTRDGRRFAFASHLPALLSVPWVPRDLATENLAEYLSFQVVHAPRTLVRGVHQLPAAHHLTVDRDDLSARRWWQMRYADPGAPAPRPADVVPALQDAVIRAVQRRMRHGVKRVLFLSGGLGSTAIASAAKTLGRDLPSYTVTLGDDPMPESPFAGRIAALLGVEHQEVVVESRDVARAFDDTVAALGHPVGDPFAILLHLLAAEASTRASLVFSGDGSEELFGGRMMDGVARTLTLARAHDRAPAPVKRWLDPVLRRTRHGAAITAPIPSWGLHQGLGGNDLFSPEERASLLAVDGADIPDVRQQVLSAFYEEVDADPINAILHAWLRSRLHELALIRTGRTTAAAGMDARYPLLDREVTAMAAALPGVAKIRRSPGSLHTRWPLVAALSGVLPPPLVNRPKRSMSSLYLWLGGAGRLFMEERVARLLGSGLFARRALTRLRADVATDAGAGRRLWTLFLLQAWIEANGIRGPVT